MRVPLVTLLLAGLATAAPAPTPAIPTYDRRLPARKGEPPAVNMFLDGAADAFAAPTATKPALVTAATGTAATAAAWHGTAANPTGALATAPPKPSGATGTGAKIAAPWPTGTGTAASISGAPTHPVVKSAYNFPRPSNVQHAAEAVPGRRFWWL